MARGAQARLDAIRNQLQVILLRAELWENPTQCTSCAMAVGEIVKEIRALEGLLQVETENPAAEPEAPKANKAGN